MRGNPPVGTSGPPSSLARLQEAPNIPEAVARAKAAAQAAPSRSPFPLSPLPQPAQSTYRCSVELVIVLVVKLIVQDAQRAFCQRPSSQHQGSPSGFALKLLTYRAATSTHAL